MSQELVAAIAKANWQMNPKLHNEFTSEGAYIAYCKAEAYLDVFFEHAGVSTGETSQT